jgi:hypothetical protein
MFSVKAAVMSPFWRAISYGKLLIPYQNVSFGWIRQYRAIKVFGTYCMVFFFEKYFLFLLTEILLKSRVCLKHST